MFLGKWLLLAYLLQALLIRYVPAAWIGTALGGEGIGPILLGAFLGAPAYLNGYAAVPLIGGLLEQGMSPGAAMSFVIAGGGELYPGGGRRLGSGQAPDLCRLYRIRADRGHSGRSRLGCGGLNYCSKPSLPLSEPRRQCGGDGCIASGISSPATRCS